MSDQANKLRGLMERRQEMPTVETQPQISAFTRTIAVTSGKGGVGKSNISLNLAIAIASLDTSVCLLDANLGLGNIDLLCGLNGYWNLSHVITGARTLQEIVLKGPGNVDVIPGASGLSDVADCPAAAQQDIFKQLAELERSYEFIIIDTGTGIHRSVRHFVTAADLALIVTTPEPTAIADAYATIKSLSATDGSELRVLVNQAESSRQAQAIIERLEQTARLFLHARIHSADYILRDHHVADAVFRRIPFLIGSPHCAASKSIQKLARRMQNLSDTRSARGAFFQRIWERFGPAAA